MDMQENWHTYWKNPGDSGGPIKVKWDTKIPKLTSAKFLASSRINPISAFDDIWI